MKSLENMAFLCSASVLSLRLFPSYDGYWPHLPTNCLIIGRGHYLSVTFVILFHCRFPCKKLYNQPCAQNCTGTLDCLSALNPDDGFILPDALAFCLYSKISCNPHFWIPKNILFHWSLTWCVFCLFLYITFHVTWLMLLSTVTYIWLD